MKNFYLIKNPFLKVVYLDCYEFAKQFNGVIFKTQIKDLVLNPNYEELFHFFYKEEKFELKNILDKLFFLSEIKKSDVSKYGFLKNSNVKDYLFLDVYEDLDKEKIFNVFIDNGLDPVLFFKTALNNVNKTKLKHSQKSKTRKSYFFNDLEQIEEDYISQIEESERKVKQEKEFAKEEGCYFFEENEEQSFSNIVHLTSIKVNGNTEKLLNKNKLKEKIILIEEKEVKNTWSYLTKMLENEGKDLKQANAIISKLVKENGMYEVVVALSKIKQRKTTPVNIVAAITFIINERKEQKVVNDNQTNASKYI